MMTSMWIDFGLGVLTLGALGGLGWAWGRLLVPKANSFERMGLAFPLGSGLMTFALFLLSWAGVPLIPSSVVITCVLLAGTAVAILVSKTRPVGEKGSNGSRVYATLEHPIYIFSMSAFILLSAAAIWFSVARAHGTWDAAAMWIIKGYGIAKEGTIFAGRTWGAQGLSYPLHIHLLVALVRMFSTDVLPATKLIFPAFGVSALLGSIGFMIRSGTGRTYAVMGALFLFTIPTFFSQATLGFVNLAMATYLALGLFWGILGLRSRDPGAQITGGILLGFASWTIVEGFLYVVTVLAAACLGILFSRRNADADRLRWRDFVRWTLAAVVVTSVWLIFYRIHGARGSQAIGTASQMWASWRVGDFNLVEARIIFGYLRRVLWRPDEWGFLFTLGTVAILLDLRRLLRARPQVEWIGLSAALGTGLLTCGLFYLRSFVGLDLFAWLQRGFPRGFMPTTLIFGVMVLLSGFAVIRPDEMAPETASDGWGL